MPHLSGGVVHRPCVGHFGGLECRGAAGCGPRGSVGGSVCPSGFFAVRGVVVSQGVEVRRATDYVCMFGISVPAGILYDKVVGCECGGVGTRINVVH